MRRTKRPPDAAAALPSRLPMRRSGCRTAPPSSHHFPHPGAQHGNHAPDKQQHLNRQTFRLGEVMRTLFPHDVPPAAANPGHLMFCSQIHRRQPLQILFGLASLPAMRGLRTLPHLGHRVLPFLYRRLRPNTGLVPAVPALFPPLGFGRASSRGCRVCSWASRLPPLGAASLLFLIF